MQWIKRTNYIRFSVYETRHLRNLPMLWQPGIKCSWLVSKRRHVSGCFQHVLSMVVGWLMCQVWWPVLCMSLNSMTCLLWNGYSHSKSRIEWCRCMACHCGNTIWVRFIWIATGWGRRQCFWMANGTLLDFPCWQIWNRPLCCLEI